MAHKKDPDSHRNQAGWADVPEVERFINHRRTGS
jgi:hypothetical protein